MAVTKITEDIVIKRGPDKTDTENGTAENANKNEIDFDDLLSSAGEFGKYQLLLFFATAPFYIFGVFVYFTQLFLTETSSDHWCWIPELENLTDIERKNLAIPLDYNSRYGYSLCSSYNVNWTEVLSMGRKPDPTWSTVPCQNGWEFNKTEIPYPTISSELGWVCDKNSYQATAQAIFFLGSIVGGFAIGWVADRYGRLPATIVCNMIGCIGGVISIFARNFIEFTMCRFFMGLAYDNCMMMVYLLVLEYVAPKYRTFMANVSMAVFYSPAVTLLPWIALASGHWKTLSLVTSLPLALSIFSPFFMPESPRWLLSNGRIDEAVNKVLNIGRINKKEISPKLLEQFKLSLSKVKPEKRQNILQLMKKPLLRRMFISICAAHICCALVFDALIRSIGALEFDFFISFSVINLTEFPSMLLIAFIMDWMGRRLLTAISMALSCIFTILTVFMTSGLSSVGCAVIARFMVNMAYGTVTQWCAEVLPTSVRGSGIAFVHICGLVASLMSSLIVYLENYVYWLPLVIVGAVAGLGAVLSLILPETANKELPQTFDEAEQLYKSQKFWEMPCKSKKVTENPNGHINNCFEM